MPLLLLPLLLYLRASMRCVLQFDECFLLQCEKEGEAENPFTSVLMFASATTSMVAYRCAHKHAHMHMNVYDVSKIHAHSLKYCTL